MKNVSSANIDGKPKLAHRKRIVFIDPALVEKRSLYRDSSGKATLGLLLETERRRERFFDVVQAAPARLTRQGIKGRVVGHWKFLNKQWSELRENGSGARKE